MANIINNTGENRKKRGRKSKASPLVVPKLPTFTTSARLDTLNVRIEFPAAVHSGNVHRLITKHTGFKNVTVLPYGKFSACPTIRLQDATPERLQRLAMLFPDQVSIIRLDVAVDLKPKDPVDVEELAQGVARCFLPKKLNNSDRIILKGHERTRQFHNGSTTTDYLEVGNKPLEPIEKGSTVYFLNEYGPLSFRIYPKVMDHDQPLPPERHVARVEAQLQSKELKARELNSLEDLVAYDLASMADLFKFAIPAKPRVLNIPKADQIINRRTQERAKANVGFFPQRLRIAFDRLNKAASRALGRLAKLCKPPANLLDTLEKLKSQKSAVLRDAAYNLIVELVNTLVLTLFVPFIEAIHAANPVTPLSDINPRGPPRDRTRRIPGAYAPQRLSTSASLWIQRQKRPTHTTHNLIYVIYFA